MQHSSGQPTSAFKYRLHTERLASRETNCTAQAAEPNLLGHINCPDARATAYVEDAGRIAILGNLRNGRLVQLFSPRYIEELVVDVHAVLLILRGVSGLDACWACGQGSPRHRGTCRCPSESCGTAVCSLHSGHRGRVRANCTHESVGWPAGGRIAVLVQRGRGASAERAVTRGRGAGLHSPIRCHRNHWSSQT